MKTMNLSTLEVFEFDENTTALWAAIAGETIDNPKTGQYWDEFHYASMELHRRKNSDYSKR